MNIEAYKNNLLRCGGKRQRYIIEETKTEAGKRKIPITEDVAQMFHAIIEDRVTEVGEGN